MDIRFVLAPCRSQRGVCTAGPALMRYAVLGTGVVGRTIAGKLDSLGHEAVIGTRDPQATLARTEPDAYGNPPYSQWQAEHPQGCLATFADAAAHGEVVVNTTAGVSSLQAAGAANLAGKLVIDIANPLDFSQGMPPLPAPVNTDSLGERIQRAFPDAKVVKTLNTMNAQIMVDPARVPGEHTCSSPAMTPRPRGPSPNCSSPSAGRPPSSSTWATLLADWAVPVGRGGGSGRWRWCGRRRVTGTPECGRGCRTSGCVAEASARTTARGASGGRSGVRGVSRAGGCRRRGT
ncbi:NADPH-dependent F420 reductase [Streptomyces sp. NPDC057438]|uniref:NADPH-dependent F420 reductase n=1 Tax=Streptomyces sp. NPDC057438 TaxID=3346133 RepID=UPI0036CD7B47